MDDIVPWFGFLGAWLLVAGPVYQAVIELSEEEFEEHQMHAAAASVPRPDPVPIWWLLVPPVWYVKRHRRGQAYRNAVTDALTPELRGAVVSYINKATGWLFVGLGGLCIALKETWELTEHQEWPAVVFWVLVLVMATLSAGNAVVRIRKTQELVEGHS